MAGLQMQEQDLIELYQLLKLYERTYQEDDAKDIQELTEDIQSRYRFITGKDIEKARNPRGAGRKQLYNADKAKEVLQVYSDCKNIRQTAKRTGVSTTYVYKAIKQ